MKGFAFSCVAIVAASGLSTTVLAADLPLPANPAPAVSDLPATVPAFDWSGAYAGAALGWGLGTFTTRSAVTGKFDEGANGLVGGIYGGYNFMLSPNILAGFEADVQYTDLNDTTTTGGVTVKTGSDWNSSLRARFGYAFDRFLVYGTGGVAIADLEVNANGLKDSTTALGWTLGAGVESAVTDNIILRLDYAYQDFSREKFNLGGTTYTTDLDNNLFRAGISYKF